MAKQFKVLLLSTTLIVLMQTPPSAKRTDDAVEKLKTVELQKQLAVIDVANTVDFLQANDAQVSGINEKHEIKKASFAIIPTKVIADIAAEYGVHKRWQGLILHKRYYPDKKPTIERRWKDLYRKDSHLS